MPSSVTILPCVLAAGWSHSLTTEGEEVMGVLLGQLREDTLHIASLIPIRRTTKQKDRVEIDPNDLVVASQRAEVLGLRVMGWYHSHPHITVHPSHVDLRTQLNFQGMDPHFVGIIFSVFNFDPKSGQDTREVIAFQTLEVAGEATRCSYLRLLPVQEQELQEEVAKSVLSSVCQVSAILEKEEVEEYTSVVGQEEGVQDLVYNRARLVSRLAEQCSVVGGPGLESLEVRELLARERIISLQARKQQLRKELQNLSKARRSSSSSQEL